MIYAPPGRRISRPRKMRSPTGTSRNKRDALNAATLARTAGMNYPRIALRAVSRESATKRVRRPLRALPLKRALRAAIKFC